MHTKIATILLGALLFACSVSNTNLSDVEGELRVSESPREVIFSVTNTGSESVEFNFTSGCQVKFVLLDDEGNTAYDSESNTGCTAALSSFTLQPEEVKVFDIKEEWIPDSISGSYILRSELIGYSDVSDTTVIVVQ
jgi:hypothetical protein